MKKIVYLRLETEEAEAIERMLEQSLNSMFPSGMEEDADEFGYVANKCWNIQEGIQKRLCLCLLGQQEKNIENIIEAEEQPQMIEVI